MLLRMRDVQPQLQDTWLQLYWPDDSRWWPAQVISINPKRQRALLLYDTGQLLRLLLLLLLPPIGLVADCRAAACWHCVNACEAAKRVHD